MQTNIRLDDGFSLDLTNMTAQTIGEGVTPQDLLEMAGKATEALSTLARIREGEVQPHGEQVKFMHLPYPDAGIVDVAKITSWADNLVGEFDAVVSIGIGGSYLGNKTIQEALAHPYFNELSAKGRGGRPKLYFAGQNLDPANLRGLLDVIDVGRTMFVLISKSGDTVEPMSAFMACYDLVKQSGHNPARHFTAITDASKGLLKEIADREGMDTFVVPAGVGGRWSVMSDVGLVTAAAAGIDISAMLAGARAMDQACQATGPESNPALAYALFHHILDKKYSKIISVIMPYVTALKSLGEWYVQLLAESLGKKMNRQGQVVHEGRTPIPAVGTTDMHAQTQQHREGKNIRALTFIRVDDFGSGEIILPDGFKDVPQLGYLCGHPMSRSLYAALTANETSLAEAGRPNCRLSIPALTPYTLGQLFFFFEMATAFEGELLNVNAYDQPGVEAYKKIMKQILRP
ncbi:MAG: glucose-6-phosphate isomerase [Deltaproteobacteria bacterium]|nr:glucose-6-phosphate isomerase [Deltaproteobacteria bacterium]